MTDFPRFCHVFVIFLMASTSSHSQNSLELQLPIDCDLGDTCFLQQMPDMDSGPGVSDPFCGRATYDGHTGTDIRLRYFSDIETNVPVLAAAAGTVLRLRDGVPDRLVQSDNDRSAIKDMECGNGVVVDHGNGWQTQYCHLKRGSLAVKEGQMVNAGQKIGFVGSSGLAQFAHVHMSVRKDGQTVDPFTGQVLGQGCFDFSRENSIWRDEGLVDWARDPTQIMDMGLSGEVVNHKQLEIELPPIATSSSDAVVGWVSLINLKKGDIIELRIKDPQGSILAQTSSDPMERSKATYSIYAGRRAAQPAGNYLLETAIVRDGQIVRSSTGTFPIQ